MNKKCLTCKYWGSGKDTNVARYANTIAYRCYKIMMREYYSDGGYDPLKCPVETVYEKDENGNVKYSEHMHHLAYVEDGSSYYAALVTRPDFGCILWEQK